MPPGPPSPRPGDTRRGDPRRGDLLISSPQLQDPNFHRSVVLLCDHGEEGSLGLVVNRPMQVPLGAVIEKLRDVPAAGQFVYQGGPVEASRLLGVRRGTHPEERSEALGEELRLLTEIEHSLDLLVEGVVDPADYRFYLGYSGWEERQLEGELEERAWIIAPATAELVLATPTPTIWSEALRALGGPYTWIADMPVHPELN